MSTDFRHATLVKDLKKAKVGVVIIGRNEGERLKKCLDSVKKLEHRIVYVDSGSTDDSIQVALSMGVDVIKLDLSRPFTAARARNAGFRRLHELDTNLGFVQFVDGDCEIREGWFEHATATFAQNAEIAVVCGRLRERHPERSIYIRMCDISWDYPTGEVATCGGVALYRSNAYIEAGGFNEALIAGEEFDLCSRIRLSGGRVLRIAEEMAWHDVGITRFSQWWKRAMRSGYAYAEGWMLNAPEVGPDYRRRTLRSLFWGLMLPCVILLGIAGYPAWPPVIAGSMAALALILAQIVRLAVRQRRIGRTWLDAFATGAYLVLGKLPEAHGIIRYWYGQALRHRTEIIEYR